MSFLVNCWSVAPTLLATKDSGTYGGFAPILSVIDSSAQCCDMARRFVLTSSQSCLCGAAMLGGVERRAVQHAGHFERPADDALSYTD